MTLLTSYCVYALVFVRNVFCFNGFNHFMWLNMVRITKKNHCFLNTLYVQQQW